MDERWVGGRRGCELNGDAAFVHTHASWGWELPSSGWALPKQVLWGLMGEQRRGRCWTAEVLWVRGGFWGLSAPLRLAGGQGPTSLVQALQDRKIIEDPAGLGGTQSPLPGPLPRALTVSDKPPYRGSFPGRVT